MTQLVVRSTRYVVGLRGLSPGGWFPPSFIHQVIIITRLNKLYNCMLLPEHGLRCRLGVNPLLKLKLPHELNISAFPPVLRDWVIKGTCMPSLACAARHIKDPVPLIEKS